MEDKALVYLEDVTLCMEENIVLRNVSLTLHNGEFVYVIGKVGSGKSSLLKALYSEIRVSEGEATVMGYDMCNMRRRDIPYLRRKLGIVFQDFQLLTDRSVFKNLEFVLKVTGWRRKEEIAKRIQEVLEQVGIPNKGYKMPHELSGGEQQRVAIARALLNTPEIILADEPTGNLDLDTATNIVALLRDITQSGTAVVMSTHNLSMLSKYPGIVYRCGDGKIKEVTDEYSKIDLTEEDDI